ncbi:uncharacterized protein [Aegilops tauschii subsp. strangulata]|uniref:uncharacterized protein n=1 Tax=Aegilops tauschii subsp. strangulata TaxID=200361 RepID=UPI00098A0A39|nr:uncharacterized protein LOC109752389 [Aegilops tauschii subsp. strangulata]
MAAYLEEVRRLKKRFLSMKLQHVPHSYNKEADDIAKQASHHEPQSPVVFEERLLRPSVAPPAVGTMVARLRAYLESGTLPEDDIEAEWLARRAEPYYLRDGDLYRKRPNGEALRCISVEQGCELLADIHGGDCSHRYSSRTLAGKVLRSRFYWPTVLQDTTELILPYEVCQFHAKQIHQPTEGL